MIKGDYYRKIAKEAVKGTTVFIRLTALGAY